jgi:lipopolysaccharide transport system ATP-binding protein
VPTEGEADVHGRVASLLEVGTGFHPELSGRENTYLNGVILGMTRREIARKFDEIVAFAEVERFIDTPVKFYSSGMYVRLAFAVAAHLDPEILIVDEVLAVGDAEFQKKCLGKIGEVATGGRTVLFVSHQMNAVAALCSRGIVLTAGRIAYDGPAAEAVGRYLDEAAVGAADLNDRPKGSDWRVTFASLSAPVYRVGEPVEVEVRVQPGALSASAFISALLINEHGVAVTQCDSRLVGFWLTGDRAVDARLRIGGVWLKPGSYTVDLFVCVQTGIVDHVERACGFEVSPILPYSHPAPADSAAAGLVFSDFHWAAVPAA